MPCLIMMIPKRTKQKDNSRVLIDLQKLLYKQQDGHNIILVAIQVEVIHQRKRYVIYQVVGQGFLNVVPTILRLYYKLVQCCGSNTCAMTINWSPNQDEYKIQLTLHIRRMNFSVQQPIPNTHPANDNWHIPQCSA